MEDDPLLDAAQITYIVFFAVGLLLGVYAMLNGSVRVNRDPSQITPPPAGFNTPVISVALMAFGAVGYLLAKYSHLDTIPIVVTAFIAAGCGWIGMTILMAKWALRGPLNDPHEELEELQGTIAIVTRDISPDTLGEVRYTFRGSPTTARARTIGGDAATAGTEVVIEKVEDGIADVELWSVVEQRL